MDELIDRLVAVLCPAGDGPAAAEFRRRLSDPKTLDWTAFLGVHPTAYDLAAKAVAAERERCAKVVEGWLALNLLAGAGDYNVPDADAIAAKIREGT